MNPKLKKNGEPEFLMLQERVRSSHPRQGYQADAQLRVVSEEKIDEDPECSISAQQRGADYQLAD